MVFTFYLILWVVYCLIIGGENMNNIYLPVDNVTDFKCYEIRDKDTIRAYYNKPAINSSSDYIDFYINSHYLEKTGNVSWGQWSQNLPTCINESNITNDIVYRFDYTESIALFSLLVLIMFWIPLKLTFFRLFRRFK